MVGEFTSRLMTAWMAPDLPGSGSAVMPVQSRAIIIYNIINNLNHSSQLSSRGRVVKAMD